MLERGYVRGDIVPPVRRGHPNLCVYLGVCVAIPHFKWLLYIGCVASI